MRALRTSLAFAALAFAALVLGCLALLGWRMIAPALYTRAPDVGCVEIEVSTNGFHSDIVVPADILPPDHPFRRLYPAARSFAVGWGDAGAFQFGNEQPWRHVDAIIPPSPTLLHIEADPQMRGRPLAVTPDGVRGLLAFLERAMRRDGQGRAIVAADGLVPGRSVFIESPDQFHIFRLCNHWTAEALQSAGLPVSPLGAWTSDSVIRQTAHFARCPGR